MIRVNLVGDCFNDPLQVAQHAASECYVEENPIFDAVFESKIDPEKSLWRTGHHTTFEHSAHYFTFQIEGISVADVTLGLHLSTPFYNTSQRSGRFCASMFKKPDFKMMEKYISFYWTGIDTSKIVEYLKTAYHFYNYELEKVQDLAREIIAKERPNATKKYIRENGVKFAQEQMRMFIPIIFPTGLDYTINLITLSSLFHLSWLPGMRSAIEQMVRLVLAKYPELGFMFVRVDDGLITKKIESLFEQIAPPCGLVGDILSFPEATLFSYRGEIILPESGEAHPLDLTQASPWLMQNNAVRIESEVLISLATMGQDQRHRTVQRTLPVYEGSIYMPPLLSRAGLSGGLEYLMLAWNNLENIIPRDLWVCLAPYGAMVRYRKSAGGNAFLHETSKRLCWCAQEEIYHLNKKFREELLSSVMIEQKEKDKLVQAISPPCVRTGRCVEGKRYCGRDLTFTGNDLFPIRTI